MLYKHKLKALPVFLMVAIIAASLSINVSRAATVGIIDVLTNQNTSVVANHTVSFYNQTAVAEGSTITLTFASAFDTSTITEDDVDVLDDSTDLTTAADCSGTEQASVAMAADVLTITICAGDGGAIAAGSRIDVKIGTNATASGTGANQITNPSTAGTHTVVLGGTFGDSGTANVYIIAPASVTITATVDPVITFDVDAALTDTDSSAPYNVNLGSLAPDTVKTSDGSAVNSIWIDIATNADGGAAITVQSANGALVSGANTIASADADLDAAYGYGICVKDVGTPTAGTLARAAAFSTTDCGYSGGTNTVEAVTASAVQILNTATDPIAGGRAEILVKAKVSAVQPAGSYSDTLTFTATGTF